MCGNHFIILGSQKAIFEKSQAWRTEYLQPDCCICKILGNRL